MEEPVRVEALLRSVPEVVLHQRRALDRSSPVLPGPESLTGVGVDDPELVARQETPMLAFISWRGVSEQWLANPAQVSDSP